MYLILPPFPGLTGKRGKFIALYRSINALAEAVNGLYKTELIRRQAPWRTVEQVELATLEYVWWCNNQRLHGELGYRTPAEAEAQYYAGLEPPRLATAGHGNH